MLTPEQRRRYQEHGFLIVEDVLSTARLEDIRCELESRYDSEGPSAGSEGVVNPGVRRLCNLFSKGRAMEALAVEPIALEVARLTIGGDIRWQAMNFHDPIPGDDIAHQAIHADRSFFPDCKGYITIAWAIDEMTEDNGATRVVPGSHHRPWPLGVLADPREVVDGEVYATCPAGSAVFIHGDVWHGGRANRSSTTRRVIHLGFACPATAPQYEIAGCLTPEITKRLGQNRALIPGTLQSFGLDGSLVSGRNVDRVMASAGVEKILSRSAAALRRAPTPALSSPRAGGYDCHQAGWRVAACHGSIRSASADARRRGPGNERVLGPRSL